MMRVLLPRCARAQNLCCCRAQCARQSQESAPHPLGCTRDEHLQRTPESMTMSTPAATASLVGLQS